MGVIDYKSLEKINELIIIYPELDDLFVNEKVEEIRNDKKFYSKIKAFTYMHLNMLEDVYDKLLSKRPPAEQKQAWEEYILEMFASNLFNQIWIKNQKLFDKNFVNYINRLLTQRNIKHS